MPRWEDTQCPGLPFQVGAGVEGMFSGEVLDGLAVLVVERFGDDDSGQDVLVAAFFAAFDASGFDAELGAAAGAGRDGHGDGAFEGRDFDLGAEQRFVHADGEVEEDVEPFAAEVRVGVDLGDDVEITVLAASNLLALAFDANAAAVFDAGGDFHVDSFQAPVAVDLEGECCAAGGLFEAEGDFMFDILAACGFASAALWSCPPTEPGTGSAGGGPAFSAACAEELVEDVAEVAKVEVFDIDAGAGAPLVGVSRAALVTGRAALTAAEPAEGVTAGHAPDAGVTELIVILLLLGIGEDVVCFLGFFELLDGLRVVLVGVGMELADELAVRFFDLVRGGVFADAENFVVITLGHCGGL